MLNTSKIIKSSHHIYQVNWKIIHFLSAFETKIVEFSFIRVCKEIKENFFSRNSEENKEDFLPETFG